MKASTGAPTRLVAGADRNSECSGGVVRTPLRFDRFQGGGGWLERVISKGAIMDLMEKLDIFYELNVN